MSKRTLIDIKQLAGTLSEGDDRLRNAIIKEISSEKEILADKIIALAGRRFIKARDVWDLNWLKDKGVDLNLDWVAAKARNYSMTGGNDLSAVKDRLLQRANELALPEVYDSFVAEMSRFLGQQQSQQWLSDPLMTQMLLMDVSEYVVQQVRRLEAPAPTSDRAEVEARLKQWRAERGAGEL